MKERLDPLIAERAPWLFSDRAIARPSRAILNGLLSYTRTLAIAEYFRDRPTAEIMDTIGQMLAQDVEVSGLSNIPATGPALIVANHPTGIADGIILNHLISRRRKDAYFMANADILRIFPQMSDFIVPVEWRQEKRCHSKRRETMAALADAMEAGRLGVIFPSGRLAKRRGLRLYERPWMRSAAMIARKYDLPVIPLHIRARNSVLFYLFDALHPTLRDITLFHETLNKARQPYRVTVGRPVPAEQLPADPDAAIADLRERTLALAGSDAPAQSLVRASRPVPGQSWA